MGKAMLSKSLIWFSVKGWGCVPSLLFDLRPNCGGGNEDNGNLLQKVTCRLCYTQCSQPCSRPLPTHTFPRLLDTHGQLWVSLLLGHCSFLLGPGEHKVLFVPSKSVFPALCKFWRLCGGVNGDLFQEGLFLTQVYCFQSPCPRSIHYWPVPPQEIVKHSSVSVSVWSLCPGAHKVCLSPLSISGRCGVWF